MLCRNCSFILATRFRFEHSTNETEDKMAVKGSKNTEQRGTKTKAGMMNENTSEDKSNKNSESETSKTLPKTSKEKSTESDSDKPLH
jgi:hypothetical protein